MKQLFRRRGSIGSLISNHGRELALIARVEARVDTGLEQRSFIEALTGQIRIQAQLQPADAAWRFYLGRLMMAAGDPAEARDELEAAAALDPRDPRIAAHLALWYEAALLAASGDHSNIDLPPLAGPNLCANTSRFAALADQRTPAVLATRAAEWARIALSFKLTTEDQRFLEYHLHLARTTHVDLGATPEPLAFATRTA